MLFQSGEFKLMRVTCDFVCCFWLKLQSFLDNEPYSNSAAENISYLLYIQIRFLLMCCFTSHTYSKYKGPFCTGKIKISINENDMNKRWEWCWHSSAGLLLQYVAFHPEWLSFVQVKIAAWMVGGTGDRQRKTTVFCQQENFNGVMFATSAPSAWQSAMKYTSYSRPQCYPNLLVMLFVRQ